LRIVRAALVADRPVVEDGAKLRGFFGRKFAENTLFHHHEGQRLLYRYPKVQYKVIGGRPIVVGVDDAADAVAEAARSTDSLWLGSARYRVQEVLFEWQDVDVGPAPLTQYEFATPWLALNERNNEIYRASDWRERKRLLGRILVGNLLSMCKGLDAIVDEELFARTRLDARRVEFKGVCLTGFLGEFQVNFRIPALLGIGKGVSQGFGTVAGTGHVPADGNQPSPDMHPFKRAVE